MPTGEVASWTAAEKAAPAQRATQSASVPTGVERQNTTTTSKAAYARTAHRRVRHAHCDGRCAATQEGAEAERDRSLRAVRGSTPRGCGSQCPLAHPTHDAGGRGGDSGGSCRGDGEGLWDARRLGGQFTHLLERPSRVAGGVCRRRPGWAEQPCSRHLRAVWRRIGLAQRGWMWAGPFAGAPRNEAGRHRLDAATDPLGLGRGEP